MKNRIRMVGFDADDTLWKSEDYFRAAEAELRTIVGRYVSLEDMGARLYAVQKRNLALFGYGAKGMALSMIEAAIDITQGKISAQDIHRIVALCKGLLQHPVALLPGVVEAVAAVAAQYEIVLITKGDLFHQEAKVRDSGLARWFGCIEIVSEKDLPTYRRLLDEFGVPPEAFVMVGNSLSSDIVPLLELGAWGLHIPYHLTWQHEQEAEVDPGHPRLRVLRQASEIPEAIAALVG